MDVQGIGRTDTGRLRPNNEDALVVDVDLGLYLVCDGVGGHAAGEVASATAVSVIERVVRDQRELIAQVEREPDRAAELTAMIVGAVRRACREVYDLARSDPAHAGMGCTATGLVVAGRKAAMAHVGDTRLYLVRRGECHQLSSDHTLAADLVRQGAIDAEAERGHPHSHVLTRALGPQPLVEVEALTFDVLAGDRLILCSDGLGDYIPSTAWLAERVASSTVEDLPDDLIDFANAAGGKDNITVIAVGVEGGSPDDTGPIRTLELRLDILRSSFLFADLSLAQLARVLDRCETRHYDAGTVVRASGEVLDELLIVTSGTLRLSASDGRDVMVGPGQHLGEAVVLRPRPVQSTITAVDRSTVLALDHPSLMDLVNRRPWLGVALLTSLGQRLSVNHDGSKPATLDLL